MKKSIVVIALVVLSFAVAQNAMAQATATQNVTLAVNAAAASPVATVDLLVRSEYIGHYTSLVGHKFFGTESKDVKRRPQLWLEYGHHRDADSRSAVRPGT